MSDARDRPTLPALLHRAATEFGDDDYVVTPTERMTFADAELRSAHAARWLLARGVGKGTRVGLFFPNGVDWIVWWLAASRVGALVVPLSTMYPPAELAKVARLADVEFLVAPTRVLKIDVAEHFERAWPDLRERRILLPEAPFLRTIVLTELTSVTWATPGPGDGDTDACPPDVLAAAESQVAPADLAVMIHTSGSTADPKGVLHTHGTVVRQTSAWPAAIAAAAGGAGGSGRILCAMPFFWVGGLLAATGALHGPVTLLVLPRLDAGAALDLVERERATGVVGWPAFTQKLRAHPTFADRDLDSAPMLRDGPLDIAMTDVPDGYPVHRTMSETAGGFVHTELAIVDAGGRPVPDGTVGELLVRGIGVMSGYHKRERWETFDDDGWYHTGDRVYRTPGDPRLFYVGRTSDLIKTSGANVSPLEVEAVVTQFPGVAQCVVVGVDDPERGEEVCAVVVAGSEPLDVEALASRSRDHLSGYKVPTRWFVVTGDDIPTLASGKLDRTTLRARINDGSLT